MGNHKQAPFDNQAVAWIEARIDDYLTHFQAIIEWAKYERDCDRAGVPPDPTIQAAYAVGRGLLADAQSAIAAAMDYDGVIVRGNLVLPSYGPVAAVIEVWRGQLDDGDVIYRIYRPYQSKPRVLYESHLRRGAAGLLDCVLAKCGKLRDAEPDVCQTYLMF